MENLSSGISRQPLRDRDRSVQKSSGLDTSPDNRQDMPTMAMGASWGSWLAAIVMCGFEFERYYEKPRSCVK